MSELDSPIICRKKLDEEWGNPQICGCPMCKPRENNVRPDTGQDGDDYPEAYCPEGVGEEGKACPGTS